MKRFTRILAVILLAVVCAGTASAQFRFGLKAGLNVNKLHVKGDNWKQTFSSDNGCGFTGGVMAEFTVPIIGVGADASVMYTHMGGEMKSIDGTNEKSDNSNFIEIPINLKYKLNVPVIASILKPYIFTGPSFAFRLNKNTLDDLKTKTCQTAGNVGLGLEFVNHVQIGASYGFGMNNVMKFVPGINATDGIKVKNNYWTVTAAYLF